MYPGVHGKERPDHPALVMARSGETVTYGMLDDRSSRLAHIFRDVGLERGDHIALFMENQSRYMDVVWAAIRSGLYVTCVNSFLSAPEVAYIVDDCMAKVLVTSAARAEVAAEAVQSCEGLALKLMADGVVDGFESLEDALDAAPEGPIADESYGGSMLYSSGSTGRPKGILRPLPAQPPASRPTWRPPPSVRGVSASRPAKVRQPGSQPSSRPATRLSRAPCASSSSSAA